jgi:hypothetical protein
MTMALLPAPDIYGYTIFCDDIRQEVGGKFIFIGAYGGPMIVHVPFPATLSTFAMGITLLQRKSVFVAKVGLRIFLPGDPDDAPSIQAEVNEIAEDAIAAATAAEAETLDPDTQGPEADRYVIAHNFLKFAPLVIKQPGIVKVRAVIGDDMVRLGALRMSPPTQGGGVQ